MEIGELEKGAGAAWEFVKSQGIVISNDEELNTLLLECVQRITTARPNLMAQGNIRCVYCYEEYEQPRSAPTAGYDGICSFTVYRSMTVSAIGLAGSALRQGAEYADGVFLHEAAHAMTPESGHNFHFKQLFETLVWEYETASGTKLKMRFAKM